MKNVRNLLMLCTVIAYCFYSCQDKRPSPQEQAMARSFPIFRFEKILFNAPVAHLSDSLRSSYAAYAPMYNTTLDDTAYVGIIRSFVSDSIMRETYRRVMQRYPSLDWLSVLLSQAFDTLKNHYTEMVVPKVFSLIVGPNEFSAAYANRVVANADYLAFSLDLYALPVLKDLAYYNYYPHYMQNMLDSVFIAPDILHHYITEVLLNQDAVQPSHSACLLDEMLHSGKLLYAVSRSLPNVPQHAILRYTPEQLEWCKNNESQFWAFLLQNRLLYEQDPLKYRTFLQEGATTKGLEGSPARLAEYMGWKIVQAYAKKNAKSVKEILTMTDYVKLFAESGYKPDKYK